MGQETPRNLVQNIEGMRETTLDKASKERSNPDEIVAIDAAYGQLINQAREFTNKLAEKDLKPEVKTALVDAFSSALTKLEARLQALNATESIQIINGTRNGIGGKLDMVASNATSKYDLARVKTALNEGDLGKAAATLASATSAEQSKRNGAATTNGLNFTGDDIN